MEFDICAPGRSNVYVSPQKTLHQGDYRKSNFRTAPEIIGVNECGLVSRSQNLPEIFEHWERQLIHAVLFTHLKRKPTTDDLMKIKKIWNYCNSGYQLLYTCQLLGFVKIFYPNGSKENGNLLEFHPHKNDDEKK